MNKFINLHEVVNKLADPNLSENIDKAGNLQKYLGFSNEEIDEIYQFASSLYQQGKYQDASSVFMILTFLNSEYYNFWLALGLSELARQSYIKAELFLMRALHLDAFRQEAYIGLAKCSVFQHFYEEAEAYLETLEEALQEQGNHEVQLPEVESIRKYIKAKK
jgi:tetratricopeptide (TPR) repeat protein